MEGACRERLEREVLPDRSLERLSVVLQRVLP